jgi:hypothetical protein
MSQSHLSEGSSEAESKADDRGEILEVTALKPLSAHYSFGTNITRKPSDFENGLDQILAEKGIFRTTPVYDIPHKELLFCFIAAVLRETPGPAEDPVRTMDRVKDQITAARLQPFSEAIRVLQGEIAAEPEYLQKYLRKTREKAKKANEDPVNIVSQQMAAAQSELYDNFNIIFNALTPYVMRTLLERLDWQWRDALRAERHALSQNRDKLTGNNAMDEDKRQAATRAARLVGESVEGRALIKAYIQVVRPELPRQTEPQYTVSPKLTVRVDPYWDAKLPFASIEKKKEILQKIICLLGQNISSKEFSKVHISRITKTLEGYKVWFMNEVNVLSPSLFVHRHEVDATVLQQTQVVHQGTNGFFVSALIAASSAEASATRFHPTFNPLFMQIKTAELDAANLTELVETGEASDFADRFAEQAILESNERMIALVNKDVDESAKLEMNMNVSTDPEIHSANEDAKAHLEKVKIQLQVLGEKLRVFSEDSPVDVRARVLHDPENVRFFHDVSILREKLVNKIRQQLQEVDTQQKELELRTQEMSRAFNEKMMANNNITAAASMSTPLRLTLSDVFGFHSSTAGVLLARLREDLVVDADKEAVTSLELLDAYVKSKLTTDQLLEKINHILFAYPKLLKNNDQGESKVFADFAARLKDNLMDQIDGLHAFELGKTTGGKLVYNHGKLMEQMRYDHASRILHDKKMLLEKIRQVGVVRDEIDGCSHLVQTLGHRFDNNRDELLQINKTRAVIDKYINEISAMLNAVSREVGYMVPEFFISMRIFSPQMNKKQEHAIMLALTTQQQNVNKVIGDIGIILKKLINTSAALGRVGARVEDVGELERRFDVNQHMIENLKPHLNAAVGEIISLTIPLINQKKVLDHSHNEIYQNLKSILFADIQSWTMRVGGEVVFIDELPYRVPHRLAAIIKAIQSVDQDASLQPGEKLKSVLLSQATSPNSVASKGMFKAVKQGLTDMKHSESVLKLAVIIDELRQLAKTAHFNTVAAFKKPLAGLAHFIKKKPGTSPRQRIKVPDEKKSVRSPRKAAKVVTRAAPITQAAEKPKNKAPKPRSRPRK